jgi:hypothetical protein
MVGNDPISVVDAVGLAGLSQPMDTGIPPPIAGNWTWASDPNNSRGGTWVNGRQSGNWDAKDSHWDIDMGNGARQRFDRWGNPISKQQAHGYRGPRQQPIRIACGRAVRCAGIVAAIAWLGNKAQAATIGRANDQLTQGIDAALESCRSQAAGSSGGKCCGCCQITIVSEMSEHGEYTSRFRQWWGVPAVTAPGGFAVNVRVYGHYRNSKCSDNPPEQSYIEVMKEIQEFMMVEM